MRIKLLAAGFFLLGGAISANAQSKGIHVQVPFDFEIANKTLPAGEYVISTEGDQVWLRVSHGNTVAVVQSNRTTHEGGKTGKVVFNCYEKLCFLSQVWLPDAEMSREVLTSKREKKAAQNAEPQQYALLGKIAK